MSIIHIGSLTLQLHRKAIKNLHISVLPPDGKLRVAAPEHMTDTAIRMAVVSRIPWIRKQQNAFAKQARQSEREMLGGESHYLWGRRYRMEFIRRHGKHEILPKGKTKLQMFISPETTIDNRRLVLNEWYRAELKEKLPPIIAKWQAKLKVDLADWGVKQMKTKWGSCNVQAKRIWLNLELAKKPPECLEYIVVHELIHLLERHHNTRFQHYLDRHLPSWRESRDLLKMLPLTNVDWAD